MVLPPMQGFNPWRVQTQQGNSSSSLNDLAQLFIRGCALEHVCAMENASRQQVLRIVIQNDPDRDMPASDFSITKALRTTNLNICKILKAGMGQTGAKSIDGTKAFWRPIYLVDHRFRYCEDYLKTLGLKQLDPLATQGYKGRVLSSSSAVSTNSLCGAPSRRIMVSRPRPRSFRMSRVSAAGSMKPWLGFCSAVLPGSLPPIIHPSISTHFHDTRWAPPACK